MKYLEIYCPETEDNYDITVRFARFQDGHTDYFHGNIQWGLGDCDYHNMEFFIIWYYGQPAGVKSFENCYQIGENQWFDPDRVAIDATIPRSHPRSITDEDLIEMLYRNSYYSCAGGCDVSYQPQWNRIMRVYRAKPKTVDEYDQNTTLVFTGMLMEYLNKKIPKIHLHLTDCILFTQK